MAVLTTFWLGACVGRSFSVLDFHSKVIYRRCFLLAIEADFLLGLATFYWNPQKKGRKGEKKSIFALAILEDGVKSYWIS